MQNLTIAEPPANITTGVGPSERPRTQEGDRHGSSGLRAVGRIWECSTECDSKWFLGLSQMVWLICMLKFVVQSMVTTRANKMIKSHLLHNHWTIL